VIVPYTGYNRHLALIGEGATCGAAKLWYDKPHKQFYLLISLELEGPDLRAVTLSSVVGVDVGQRYLAVTTDTHDQTSFYSGKQVRAKADHYARLRKRLQRKGTRSATRRLMAISGRERRLKLHTNHHIAKRIVDQHPHSLIGLENLTDIRERSKRKRGKHASKKQRRANQHASRWAFAELHGILAYKAARAGSLTAKVDAHFTSQACLHMWLYQQDQPSRERSTVCLSELPLHAPC
jgi:IS605 OrfB family transposase